MSQELDALLQALWDDYADLNPQARRIHALLADEGEVVVNDHIALRTFDDPRVDLEVLAAPFERAGYRAAGAYRFAEKKLRARHWEHPDPARPKLFISALELGRCSEALRERVAGLLAQVPAALLASPSLPACGRPWSVSAAEVEALRGESEYAAWLAAFGFRANHFTVLVNALRRFHDLQSLCAFLKGHGFSLSQAGGEIKGAPALGLEQASTLAGEVVLPLADGPHRVPGCYYEFARRHPGPDGRLFQGFLEGSADKIFESTDRQAGATSS